MQSHLVNFPLNSLYYCWVESIKRFQMLAIGRKKTSNFFMGCWFCLYNFYKEVIKVKPPNITPAALGMMRIQSFLGSFVQP